jgi:hypothetical protein
MSLGLVGTHLGRFEILSEVGQGGMSVVYRALDPQLQRQVAIKVMHPFLAEKPEARARLRREAVAVARLRHPHIVEIFEYSGETAAPSYIVTELVEGTSLAAVLADGPFSPAEGALPVARAIASALVHAHEHSVIHRDLKPENILVGQDGTLKLTDFGIAHMLDNQTLTVTGTLLGSPAYMAPEYIDGAPSDARADVYSFGAMLYQFVTGKLPFEGPSPHALLKRIVASEFIPPEQRNPSVHAAVARVIKKAMARNPAERYQTAKEALAAIDAILTRLGVDGEAVLPRVLASPHAGPELERRIVPRYVALGKAELAARRVGSALEDFDRVLSIEPEHPEVRRIVRRLAQRAWAGRSARLGALALVGAAIVTLGLGTLLGRPELPEPAREPAGVEGAAPEPQAARAVPFLVRGVGDLYVDGRLEARGASGRVTRELVPGAHLVRIVGSRRDTTVPLEVPASGDFGPITLDAGPRETAVTPATPAETSPQTPPPSRTVLIRAKDGLWLNVWVDEVQVMREQPSPVRLELTHGRHRLRFSNLCCEPVTLDLNVSATEPPELEPIELRPSPARLFIDGAPEGARVEVAGKAEGLRPGEPVFVPMATRAPARHEVVVIHDGQVLVRQAVNFEPGRPTHVVVPSESPRDTP